MAGRQQQKRRAREQRVAREREAARAARRTTLRTYATGGLLAAAGIATLLAVTLSGGGEDQRASGGAGGGGGGAQPGHIHGLGVNPADGSLYIATHGGLFRASPGSMQAPRVGRSDRDLMGFSVVGRDHFLASGHPGSESGLPANIGLTESRDAGQTWKPVSLLGEADFHVLRASGRRVYGYDGPNARFMASSDLGRDWSERRMPAAPFDLVIDPSDRDHLLAATEAGLLESRDAGRSWRSRSDRVALLAWPARNRLLLLDANGRVLVSRDGGRTARAQGRVDGQAVSFTGTGDVVYVALADGTVMQSADAGRSFTVRARL